MFDRSRSSPHFLVLALLVAGLVVPAKAVQLSRDGNGQVLLFPAIAHGLRYDTLLSVTNSDTERPTVVRLTVRDGADGAVRARVNVYLGAGDTFTAASDGQTLTPTDNTCYASEPEPSESGAIALGLEGTAFLEVIEMGTVPPGTATATLVNEPGDDCPAVRQAVADRAALHGLEAPAGQVTGSLTLIDVPLGLSFPMAPTALDQFRDSPIYRPADSPRPDLADAQPAESVLVGRFATGGEPFAALTSTWEHPVDAVSAVLTATTLSTDFNVEPGLAANTDVVLAFPTRHHYQGPTPDDERAPFVTRHVRSNVNFEPIETPGQQFLVIARDREGDTVIDTFGAKCSPVIVNPYPGPLLTGSQLNLRVGRGEVLPGMAVYEVGQVSVPDDCRSVHATPVHEIMDFGNLEMDFRPYAMTSVEGHVHYGLPVIAASLTSFANEATTLANYGILNTVRGDRHVTYPVLFSGPDSEVLSSDEERAAPQPDISGDGSVIAWSTDVSLAPEDTDTGDPEKIGHQDVYLFVDGELQPRLATPTLSEFPEKVEIFDLASNGEALVYLVCKAVPTGSDTFRCEYELRLHSLPNGDTSEIQAPSSAIHPFERPRISADGSLVAFHGIDGIYLYDAAAESSEKLADDVKRLFDMTRDGSLVLFSRGELGVDSEPDRLFLVDNTTGTEQEVLPPDLRERLDAESDKLLVYGAAISESGRYLVFSSAGGIQGHYWYDREADQLHTLSHADSIFINAGEMAITADGRMVSFAQRHSHTTGLPPDVYQVHVWRPGGSSHVVSVSADGFAGNGDSLRPALSDTGRFLVYSSAADNIGAPGPIPDETPDPAYHLIRVDLQPEEG